MVVDVSPDSEYEVKSIRVNGVAQPVTESFELTVNEDTVVQAVFQEIPQVAPAIAKTAVVQGTTYDGQPAVVAYSQLNQFTAASNVRYGMYFWRGGAEEKETADVLPLYVRNSQTSEPDEVSAGQAFGIRCFGTAITSGNTYSFQPFAGDAVEYTMTTESEDE